MTNLMVLVENTVLLEKFDRRKVRGGFWQALKLFSGVIKAVFF